MELVGGVCTCSLVLTRVRQAAVGNPSASNSESAQTAAEIGDVTKAQSVKKLTIIFLVSAGPKIYSMKNCL